jgi:Family of unknown function (DUF5670)
LLHSSILWFDVSRNKYLPIGFRQISQKQTTSRDASASKGSVAEGASTQEAIGGEMLWTIFVILLVLWLLGIVSSYTLGGFIHILLVIALVVLLIQLISGRRPVV